LRASPVGRAGRWPRAWPSRYVKGTLLAVRKVAGVIGVRRGLDSILFDGPSA